MFGQVICSSHQSQLSDKGKSTYTCINLLHIFVDTSRVVTAYTK